MSIKLRFGLVLGTMLGGFLLFFVFLLVWERSDLEQAAGAAREERRHFAARWLELSTASFEQVTADIARAAAAPGQLQALAAKYDLDGIALLRADGSVADGDASLGAVAEVARTERSARFFREDDGELREYCIRPVAAAGAPGAAGWVVAMRSWNERRLQAAAGLIGAEAALARPDQPAPAALMLRQPLADERGRTVREIRVIVPADPAGATVQSLLRQSFVFGAFGLLLIATLGLCLRLWVLRPLNDITSSLALSSPDPVEEMSKRGDEYGSVARLIRTFFAERRALEREVDERTRAEKALRLSEETLRDTLAERARLGRDLHDGVIQSLYAAGMGLAGVEAQLRAGGHGAAPQIEQTRVALNETIRDVRNFIIGLEPESLRHRSFRQALDTLFEFVRSATPVDAGIDIDEAAAGRLDLDQRVHALLIAREAVSNAIRHGRATAIHVLLRVNGDATEFSIRDNGSGFDASAQGHTPGMGLVNLRERARELGAVLTVDSAPGRGTTVRLSIPFADTPSS